MKKVLLVVPSITGGGFEKAAVDTCKTLKEFCNVKLVVFHRHEVEYETDCEIISFDVGVGKNKISKFFNQLKRISMLKKLRNIENADVVYSFGATANITNALSNGAKGKTVTSVHGYKQASKSFLSKLVYKRSDAVTCVSKEITNKVKTDYPFIKNVVTIENGYDIEEICNKSNESVELKKADFNLIAMGRFVEVKGYNRLIKAFSLVNQKLQNSKLFILGGGPLEQDLKSLVNTLNLNDSVEFLGYQKNPYAYLSKMDAFVMSSYNEGFPNAIIESLACNLAVVSVDCKSGPKEILSEVYSDKTIENYSNEKYGVLTENSSDDERVYHCLANAIINLGEDKELFEKYKKLANERAKCFSLENYKQKFVDLFSLIDGEI